MWRNRVESDMTLWVCILEVCDAIRTERSVMMIERHREQGSARQGHCTLWGL